YGSLIAAFKNLSCPSRVPLSTKKITEKWKLPQFVLSTDLKAAVQTITLATFTFTFDKTSAIEREERPDPITMEIVVEEGNVDVGNTAEPSYEVVARSGCSAQLSTNDIDEHELAIESEDSKVSVGNAAKQSHDVVGVGIDCIFNHAKVSTEADLGPQPDVIHLTSLDVPNESSQISSDADMVEQNKKDALDTLIRISQHKKPKKSNVARVVSEDYKCTPEDVQLIEYIKTLPGKQVVVNIDSAWLNRNDMECLFHGDIELSGEVSTSVCPYYIHAYIHCIRDEEHLLHREGGKVFLENTFISSLLKRDGDPKMLLNYKEDTIETRMDNYLQSDMVFIPMNIENFHWYLAVLNAKKSEHCSLSPLPAYEPAFDWENERSLIFGQRVPESIPAISNSGLKITVKSVCVKMIAAGTEHTAVVTEDGDLYGWGWGRYGNLGLGDRNDRLLPEKVSSVE
ncbi:hypothetical protein ACJX0J_029163, partial [Zea mays]